MKKKIALLALGLFAGSASLSMAEPFVSANLRLAPGLHVTVGNRPLVVSNIRRSPLPVVVSGRYASAPVVCRPVVEKRVVYASRWDRFHRHRLDRRYDRNDFRSFGDHGRRD